MPTTPRSLSRTHTHTQHWQAFDRATNEHTAVFVSVIISVTIAQSLTLIVMFVLVRAT